MNIKTENIYEIGNLKQCNRRNCAPSLGSSSAYGVPIVTFINKSSQMSHKTIKTFTSTWQPFLFKGNFITYYNCFVSMYDELYRSALVIFISESSGGLNKHVMYGTI